MKEESIARWKSGYKVHGPMKRRKEKRRGG